MSLLGGVVHMGFRCYVIKSFDFETVLSLMA